MDYEIAAPRASALVESLRGFGYSAGAAVADLVDNSISAGARNVWIRFQFDGPSSTMLILDDGRGMTEDELKRAMVLGASSPLDSRGTADLGRFGLGLKTASFSQCRCLTVASRKEGRTTVRRWDLDYIASSTSDEWRLLSGPRPGSDGQLGCLDDMSAGTLVLWEAMDRVTAGMRKGDRKSEDAFFQVVEAIEWHLSLVFHKFLGGRDPGVRIFVEKRRLKPWDPFLQSHPATEATPPEIIPAADGPVELQGFVLPHKDQLTEDEVRRGGGSEGWAAHQGFYIYRGRRLLVGGGWLGLGSPRPWTMEEPYRLARLRVEFGNTSDSSWDIDVKKSVARPPRLLRPRMTALAEIVRRKARDVFAHRGNYGARASVPNLESTWESRSSGSGYRINRKHPVVAAAIEVAGDTRASVEAVLKLVEATVPVERIWLDTAERGEVSEPKPADEAPAELVSIAKSLVAHWTGKLGMTSSEAARRLRATDPFHNYPSLIAAVLRNMSPTENDE